MWIPQCAQCFLHFWRYNNIPWKPVCHWDFDILMWLLPSWCDFLPTRCYMGLMWLLPNWCDLNPSLVHSLEVWLVFVVKLFTILRSWFRKTFAPEGLLAFWTTTHARWPTRIRILSLCGSGFAARQFLGLQPLKVLLRAGVEPEQSVWKWVFNFQFWHPNGEKTRGEAYCSMYICRAPLFCTQGSWGVCFLYLFVIFVFQSRFLAYVAFLALCGFLAFFLSGFLVFFGFCGFLAVCCNYRAATSKTSIKRTKGQWQCSLRQARSKKVIYRNTLTKIQRNYLYPTRFCLNLLSICSQFACCASKTTWVQVLSFCLGELHPPPIPPPLNCFLNPSLHTCTYTTLHAHTHIYIWYV